MSLPERVDRGEKRALDVILASAAVLALSPLLLLVAAILRVTGEGEVFYGQERIGRGGVPFRILKFATMLKDSPNLPGGDITGRRDPRVLPVGRVLRKTKLNELPQLLNVIAGDMSLIGPRPLTRRLYDGFPAAYQEAVRSLRPGLSGIGSIVFRDEEMLFTGTEDRERIYVELIQPHKAELEQWYADNRNLWIDLKLIALTVAAIVHPTLDAARFFPGLPRPSGPLAAALSRSD